MAGPPAATTSTLGPGDGQTGLSHLKTLARRLLRGQKGSPHVWICGEAWLLRGTHTGQARRGDGRPGHARTSQQGVLPGLPFSLRKSEGCTAVAEPIAPDPALMLWTLDPTRPFPRTGQGPPECRTTRRRASGREAAGLPAPHAGRCSTPFRLRVRKGKNKTNN